MRKRIIVLSAILILIGWWFYKNDNGAKKTNYQTAMVSKGSLVSFLSLSGQVTGSNATSVTTEATGVIKRIWVKDGETVKSGQKIAEMELDMAGKQNAEGAWASYQSAKNSLISAENNLRAAEASLAVVYDQIKGHDSDETLVVKETRTKAEVSKDSAYLNMINARANISSSWLKYQQASSTIYAPISGTISGFALQPGTIISSATKVANVLTEGTPTLSLNLTETDVGKIKLNQKATITFDALTDKTYTGKVISIDTVGIVSSGVVSYPAVILMDNKSQSLLPNMTGTAKIILESKDEVLMVPMSAVKNSNGTSTIIRVKSNKTEIVEVVTGISDGSNVEIVSGLNEGETVVINGGTTATGNARGNSGGSIFGGGGSNIMRIAR